MYNYEMKVFPKLDADGKIYWTAMFPAIPQCVGGGDTPEEAITEAQSNLEIYIEYLKEEKRGIPAEYKSNEFSGKIALRLPKTTHKKVSEIAENEGVSINSLLIAATENYLGIQDVLSSINQKINELQDIANKSYVLQQINAQINASLISNPVAFQTKINFGE